MSRNDEGSALATPTPQEQTKADNGIVAQRRGTGKINPTKLAAQINAEHVAAHADAQSAMQRVRKCGELLMQAKAQTPHGEWVPWIEANLRFGARQAQKYIRLAETWERVANANSDSLLPSIDAALATVAEPREVSAKASKPHTKAKPIRVAGVEVPASRVQTVLDELDRPEAFTPERTTHAMTLVRDLLTTGDAKTASIEQVAAMRHPPAANLPSAAPPDPKDDPDVAEEDRKIEARMVTPVDFEALQVIRWMGSLDVGSLTDPALILTEMQDYLGYMKRTAGIVDASRTIAASATALAVAFDTTEPIKAADRAAMDKLRRVLWNRCSSVKKLGNAAAIEAAVAGLVEQGKRNAATVSITTVGILAHELKAALLDQLLIDASEGAT